MDYDCHLVASRVLFYSTFEIFFTYLFKNILFLLSFKMFDPTHKKIDVFDKPENKFQDMFIYTENSLNLIETLKTSLYNPKHPKTTKIHLQFFETYKMIENIFFKRIDVQTNHRFMLSFIALFIMLRAIHFI